MEPGKVFTVDELKEQLNITSEEEVHKFLDLLEKEETSYLKVVNLINERMLVFDTRYWKDLQTLMWFG